MDTARGAIAERRAAVRYPALLVEWGRIRVRPGHPVDLVDVAASGMCVDTLRRLLPGTVVDLQWERGVGTRVYRARVVRCAVVAIAADRVSYRAGLALDRSCSDISSLLLNGNELPDSTCPGFPDSIPVVTRKAPAASRVHEKGGANY